MHDPWIGTQLFLGTEERRAFPLRDAEKLIRRAREIGRIDGLMIWPCRDREYLGALVEASRACGIETYLWFSVLADVPGLEAAPTDLVECFDGERGNGKSGAWPGLSGGDETFSFICPNKAPAVDRVFDEYASLLDAHPFDGVMLDRIRFPSPANGLESLFTCFCDDCRSLFEMDYSLPLVTLRDRAGSFIQRMGSLTLDAFKGEWRQADSLWSAAGIQDLASFRARSILGVVQRFSSHARRRGLKVGLDVFSPSLAPLVGQDMALLGGACDWMKPMIYCHAVGPAGLPLELASLGRALRVLCPRLSGSDVTAILAVLFPWDIPGGIPPEAELLAGGLDETLVTHELTALYASLYGGASDLDGRAHIEPNGARASPAIYAGIEAVSIPRYGISITPEILERYINALHPPVGGMLAEGLIASWNLLAIPESSLRRIGALKG